MEITIQASVPAKTYFDFILSTIRTDIDLDEKEDMPIEKGLTFTKATTVGMSSEMCKVKITEYEYPKIIELKYVSSKGTNILKYFITAIDKDSCTVTYKETRYDSNNIEKKYSSFFENSFKKKMKKRMIAVENHLKQQTQSFD